MDLGLKGKVALAAAASEGIGRAVAEALAVEGADLIICSRREAPLEKAQRELEEHGGRVLAVPANLTDPSGVKEVAAAALEAFGRVDVLVTNTGGPPVGTFEELDEALKYVKSGDNVPMTILRKGRKIDVSLKL